MTAKPVVLVTRKLPDAVMARAAAGLDVFEGEPRIHGGYRTLDNVFILPHMGSATLETRNAMGFKCCDNLDAVFAGREPSDRVV